MNYTTLASADSIAKTSATLSERGFLPQVVATHDEALEKVKGLIPADASLMNGASVTLEEIGFIEYLKSGQHGWRNLHDAVLAEKDPAKQATLRKQSALSDYYIGSVHALSETGEMVVVSNSGSQIPHLAFTSPNIILVVGSHKIVPTLMEALARVENHVMALEDARAQKAYGVGTLRAKTLILHKENPKMGRKVHVIIVQEKLGF